MAWWCLRRSGCRCVVSVRLSLLFSQCFLFLVLPLVAVFYRTLHIRFFLFTLYIYLQENTLIRRRSTRHPPQRPSLLAISSQVSHSFMRYTISRGSAHSSLSLDVGVAATPIPHSNPIPFYTTISVAVRVISTKFSTLMHLSQPVLVLVLLWREGSIRRETHVLVCCIQLS